MSDPRLGYAYSYGAEPSGFVGAAPPSASGAVWRGSGTARTQHLERSDAVPLAWNNNHNNHNNVQPPFGVGLARRPQQQQQQRAAAPYTYGQSYAGSGYSDDEGSAGSDIEEVFSDADDNAASDEDDDGLVYSDDENGGANGGVYGPPASSWW